MVRLRCQSNPKTSSDEKCAGRGLGSFLATQPQTGKSPFHVPQYPAHSDWLSTGRVVSETTAQESFQSALARTRQTG